MFKCKQCGRQFGANTPKECPDCGAQTDAPEHHSGFKVLWFLMIAASFELIAIAVILGIVIALGIKYL